MSLFGNLFGQSGPSFSRRKEWDKLKTNVESMQWRLPKAEDLNANKKNLERDSSLNISLIGSTYTREIAGMIENKLRVFGLTSPQHFSVHRYPHNERDEYSFWFTEIGIKTLAKKGIKLENKIPKS